MDKFTVGSRAFFSGMDGYNPKDYDTLYLVDQGNGYKYIKQVSSAGSCQFFMVRNAKEVLIDYALNNSPSMAINKFLVPGLVNELGITIDDLRQLQPMVDKLDAKHRYLRTIYEAYLANGSFTLTDEQRADAFEVYRAARQDKTDKNAG